MTLARTSVVVARARDMQDRRSRCAPGLDDELVQRARAREGTEDAEDPPVCGQLEDLTRVGLSGGRERAGIGRPTTRAFVPW